MSIKSLLASLPYIEIGLNDWHLYVSLGSRRVGMTVGPHFLSLDYRGDIAYQLISPPKDYQAPLSDCSFLWTNRPKSSFDGLVESVHNAPNGGPYRLVTDWPGAVRTNRSPH